jgi:hypothetical protein
VSDHLHTYKEFLNTVGKSRILNMAKRCNSDIITNEGNACEIFAKVLFLEGIK